MPHHTVHFLWIWKVTAWLGYKVRGRDINTKTVLKLHEKVVQTNITSCWQNKNNKKVSTYICTYVGIISRWYPASHLFQPLPSGCKYRVMWVTASRFQNSFTFKQYTLLASVYKQQSNCAQSFLVILFSTLFSTPSMHCSDAGMKWKRGCVCLCVCACGQASMYICMWL